MPPAVTAIFTALLGWACGMLVNWLADVLPVCRKPARPFCLNCKGPLPVRNYLVWPRRCPACGTRRGWRTWLVEAFFVLATLALSQFTPPRLGFPLSLVLLIYLGVVVVIDLEHRLILHPVSLVGVALGLWVGVQQHSLVETILGGLAGFGIMFFFYFLGIYFARWINRRRGILIEEGDALGFGDVALSGVLGLMVGWPGILITLVAGTFTGALVSLLILLGMALSRSYKPFAAIPYGPFLALGGAILLFILNF